jgi:hypothetical protein
VTTAPARSTPAGRPRRGRHRAFALGAEGARWAAEQPGCLVYAVDERRRVLRSPGPDPMLVDTDQAWADRVKLTKNSDGEDLHVLPIPGDQRAARRLFSQYRTEIGDPYELSG